MMNMMIPRITSRPGTHMLTRVYRCILGSSVTSSGFGVLSCRRRLLRFFSTSALPLCQDPGGVSDLATCNSRIQELARTGRIHEARRMFDDMPYRNAVSWNSIIAGYFLNGMTNEAQAVFDTFAGKNTRTWTIVVSGYAKAGHVSVARHLFDSMPERNVVSWNAMITGYVQNGDINSARELFEKMPGRDVVSWNSMITGYCHAHRMSEARELFERMPERNLVSWTVLISGYVQISDFREAWNVVLHMHSSGLKPDQSNFVASVSATAGLCDLKLLENMRTWAIKTNYEGDVVVGTAVLNAYTRCSRNIDYAAQFFDEMPNKNDFSWSTIIAAFSQIGHLDDAISFYDRDPEKSVASRSAMLTGYAQNGRIHEARLLFEQIPNPSVISWNAMIAGYAQNGMLKEATDFFNRMPERNAISWAAIIAGHAQYGNSTEALDLFSELHTLGIFPSESSFTSSLFACANIGSLEMGRQIHTLVIKAGSQFNTYVGNGLISLYAKTNNLEDVMHVFRKMKARDTVSWNSLIAGLSHNNMLEDARNVFEQMPKRDVVSWTSLISAYMQSGHGDEAVELFSRMLLEGTKPNSATLTSLISTCAHLGTTKLGQQIHGTAFKLGLQSELFVGNALITMYFKCGCIDSFWVFEEMSEHDIITWNAMLAGCAQHGFGRKGIEVFKQMNSEGVLPNHITFVGLLCACSHAGLVDEGWQYFNSMSRDYGLMPLEGHYACMVDLLGRAGHLYEAEKFIENMPIEPDSVVWAALLGACRIHRNIELGRKVAERLFHMVPQNSGIYVLLSNIYASLGMWDEVGQVRKLMRDRGLVKEPGCSWMQIKNRMHNFFNGDTQHEHTEEIRATLKELYDRLKATGYLPDANFVLHDVEEEQKEDVLLFHSEKLAIAYALLYAPNGTPIQIMKNLRICGDCHAFIKFVSKDTGREIDVRDGNRFHHFRNGVCSCGDYW